MNKLTPTKPLTLRVPPYARVHLTLVGCGGTGSHIASGLASIALALADKGTACDMWFVDPDKVEPKNVGRQLFGPADVGRAKAEVLADRLNRSYGLSIGASVRRIDDADTFLGNDRGDLNVVIGAVDNNAARAIIAKAVKKANGRLWWLDAGNENHSGNVVLGNVTDKKKLKPALGLIDSLPALPLLYPDVLRPAKGEKPKAKTRIHGLSEGVNRDPSCAELAATGEQSLMVNRMAAAWALTMLHDFLLGELKYFGVAFDLGQGGVKTWALDDETVKKI